MSDWTSAVDPGSGATYYYNSVTGETRWEAPDELAADTAATVPAAAGSAADWTSAVDPGSGATYYYNSVTGETSWEKPQALIDAEASSGAAATPSVDTAASPTKAVGASSPTVKSPTKRVSAKERLEKRKLSILKKRGKDKEDKGSKGEKKKLTRAEKLKARSAKFAKMRAAKNGKKMFRTPGPPPGGAKPSTEAAVTTDPTSALPEGWEQVTDEASGSVYYYNATTGETSWEAPSA